MPAFRFTTNDLLGTQLMPNMSTMATTTPCSTIRSTATTTTASMLPTTVASIPIADLVSKSPPRGNTSSEKAKTSSNVSGHTTTGTSSSSSSSSSSTNSEEFMQNLFKAIDMDQNGRISLPEIEGVLMRINSRLNRTYGEDDLAALFQTLDADGDGSIDFEEFRAGFRNLGVF